MAERRMFAKTIVLSDSFLDLPMSSRCLYFTLSMLADDEGFVNNPKSIMRQCGATTDDMLLLLSKKFLLDFDSGVIVIKHWRINNYLRSDRCQETKYVDERSQLTIEENGGYKKNGIPSDNQVPTTCLPTGIPSIDKNSIDKNSIDKSNSKHRFGEYSNVLLTMEEYDKLKKDVPDTDTYIERLSEYIASKGAKYKSHYATIRSWYNRDKASKPKAETQQPSYEIEEFSEYKKPVYKSN